MNEWGKDKKRATYFPAWWSTKEEAKSFCWECDVKQWSAAKFTSSTRFFHLFIVPFSQNESFKWLSVMWQGNLLIIIKRAVLHLKSFKVCLHKQHHFCTHTHTAWASCWCLALCSGLLGLFIPQRSEKAVKGSAFRAQQCSLLFLLYGI